MVRTELEGSRESFEVDIITPDQLRSLGTIIGQIEERLARQDPALDRRLNDISMRQQRVVQILVDEQALEEAIVESRKEARAILEEKGRLLERFTEQARLTFAQARAAEVIGHLPRSQGTFEHNSGDTAGKWAEIAGESLPSIVSSHVMSSIEAANATWGSTVISRMRFSLKYASGFAKKLGASDWEASFSIERNSGFGQGLVTQERHPGGQRGAWLPTQEPSSVKQSATIYS